MIKKIIPILTLIIYLVAFLVSYPYIFDNFFGSEKLDSIRNIFEYGIMFCSFIVFNALLFKNKYTSILSVILCLLLGINILISISCFFIYHSGFNVGMAVSILDTNLSEAKSMSYMFVIPILLFLFFLSMLLCTINIVKNKIKLNYKFVAFAMIWILLPYAFFLKHKYISNKGGGHVIKNTYYHLSDFMSALSIQNDIDNIKNNIPVFKLKKIQPGIENIVLVIGESVRKQNMSLYGYPVKTTPNADSEANNMMIYNNAISPAGITYISVPLMLSNIEPSDFKTHHEKLSNNIINLANQAQYNTSWISTQAGARGITAIASMAKTKKWINGYDEVIIPELNKIIQPKEDKLIVLHIIGSHPNPCDRIPDTWNSKGMNCYDSSISYTDSIMKDLFKKLKNTNSVVIYVSDHGLKIQGDKLLHTDSKESTQVPFFVWFGDKVPSEYKITGRDNTLMQTTYIYPLLMKYMGLETPQHYKNEKLQYLKTDMTPIDYKQLEN